MENKIIIVERLLEEKRITFREALTLIGFEQKAEVKDIIPPLDNYNKWRDRLYSPLIQGTTILFIPQIFYGSGEPLVSGREEVVGISRQRLGSNNKE